MVDEMASSKVFREFWMVLIYPQIEYGLKFDPPKRGYSKSTNICGPGP